MSGTEPLIRWDKAGNTIRSIRNLRHSSPRGYDGDPVAAASEALNTVGPVLGIPSARTAFRLAKTAASDLGQVVVRFKQYLSGVEVEGGSLVVGVATEGNLRFLPGDVTSIRGHLYLGSPKSGVSFISESDAIDIAIEHLGGLSASLFEETYTRFLPVNPDDGLSELRLAYFIPLTLTTSVGSDLVLVVVDAQSGETIRSSGGSGVTRQRGSTEFASLRHQVRPSISVPGLVETKNGVLDQHAIAPSPVSCNTAPCAFIYVTDPIEDTYGYSYERILGTTGDCLDGTYVKVVQDTIDGDTTCENAGDYFYTVGTQEWEDASAYYHVDNLGIGNLRLSLTELDPPVAVVTHASITSPARVRNYYCDYIQLNGADSNGLYPAAAGEVVVHEYMHVIANRHQPTFCNNTEGETPGLFEGISDYYAIAYRIAAGGSSTVVGSYLGEWGNLTDFSRNVNNSVNAFDWPSDFNSNGNTDYYDRGMIISGALWRFRNAYQYGYGRAINEALGGLPDNPDFDDMYDAIWGSARCEFHNCYDDLEAHFGFHGLGDSPIWPRRARQVQLLAATGDDFAINRTHGMSVSVHPNPFNPSTNIALRLPAKSVVSVAVFDILGRRVASLADKVGYDLGDHVLSWNADGLPSGSYYVRISTGSETRTLAVTLLK